MEVLTMEVIMSQTTGVFTSREVQDMVDLRVDKAAEEIGYATGMLIMELLNKSPTFDNAASHADVFHSLRRVRDVVRGRSGKVAADSFTQAVRFMLDLTHRRR